MRTVTQEIFREPKDTPELDRFPLVIHQRDEPTRSRALVVFVHGLGGSRYGENSTWGFFPQLVFEDFPDADVGMAQYRTLVGRFRFWESVPLEEEAIVFADIIRDVSHYRSVVLLAHSMGGILCGAVIRHLVHTNQVAGLSKIAGLILMASPQTGSQRVPRVLGFLSQDALALKPHNRLVTSIYETFVDRLNLDETQVVRGRFTIPTWAVLGSSDFWVDRLGARLHLPSDRTKTVRGSHTRIVKPLSKDDEGYAFVRGCIRTALERAGSAANPAGGEVAGRVSEIVRSVSGVFVGRDSQNSRLDRFIADNSSGILLVTADAGFGKTALLANWAKSRHPQACFVAQHFFSLRMEVTRPLANAYRNLLNQINQYRGAGEGEIARLLSEEEERERLYRAIENPPANKLRLVLVIDALDEAQHPFSSPFPNPLPPNVCAIISARSAKKGHPAYLRGWEWAERIHLDRLDFAALVAWVSRAGPALSRLATDVPFIRALETATQGFPLYTSYLLEDLVRAAKGGRDVRALLTSTPEGFQKYVREQVERLDELSTPEKYRGVFSLLAVARGSFTRAEMKAIAGLDDRELRELSYQWLIARWLSGDRDQDRLERFSFAHPLLARRFARALGDEARRAEGNLLEWCRRWKSHGGSYALRHYAEHLDKGRHWAELFSLGRDTEFADAQWRSPGAQPDLPLTTCRIALRAASRRDEAPALAALVLTQAARIEQAIGSETPLAALRAGSLGRAWQLADLNETEHRSLHYLLLAWEFQDQERGDRARETLERLLTRPLSIGEDWQERFAVLAMAGLPGVPADTIAHIQGLLFDPSSKQKLCLRLAELGRFDTALTVARHTDEAPSGRFLDMFSGIGERQAAAGDLDGARKTFSEALEEASHREGWDGDQGIISIAAAMVRAGLRDEGRDRFDQFRQTLIDRDPNWAVKWLLEETATAEMSVGLEREARRSFEAASRVRFRTGSAPQSALAGTARTLAALGDTQAAWEALEELEETEWVRVLEQIVVTRARSGQIDAALEALERMHAVSSSLLGAVEAVVEARMRTGDVAAALEIARKYTGGDRYYWEECIRAIVRAQAGTRDFSGAEATAALVDGTDSHAKALASIAEQQAKVDPVGASRMLERAMQAADRLDAYHERANAFVSVAESAVQMRENVRARDALSAALASRRTEAEEAKPQALCSIAQAYARWPGADPDGVRSVLRGAIQAALRIDNTDSHDNALSGIVDTLGTVPAFEDSADVLAAFRHPSQGFQARVALIVHRAKAGQVATALRMIDELRSETESRLTHAGYISLCIAIADILEAQCRSGDVAGALERARKSPEALTRALGLSKVAPFLAVASTETAETIREALAAVDEIDDWNRDEALSQVAAAQSEMARMRADKGLFDQALGVVRRIANPAKILALVDVAEKQRLAGLLEDSKVTLREATEFARSIIQGWSIRAELEALTKAWARHGDIEAALSLVGLLTEEPSPPYGDIAELIASIGVEQAALGDTDAAMLRFEEAGREALRPDSRAPKALATVAAARATAGFGAQALDTFDLIVSRRDDVLPDVAASLVNAGDREYFKRLLLQVASRESAYACCGLLAGLYPARALEIAEVVQESARPTRVNGSASAPPTSR